MKDLIKQILLFLLDNYELYVLAALVISMSLIMIVLNFAKIPIKKLTSKIPNEHIRKLANNCIIITMAFGLSALGWVVLHAILPNYFEINMTLILLDGAFPIVAYAYADGVIPKKKALEITETIKEIANDGEITNEEIKEVVEKSLTAEEELNELLK